MRQLLMKLLSYFSRKWGSLTFQYVKEIGKPDTLPFKEVLFINENVTNKTSIVSSVVPLDEVWEINQVYFYSNNIATLRLLKLITGIGYIFEKKDSTTWIAWSGKMFLEAGEQLLADVSVSSNLVLNAFGVKRLSLEATLASLKVRLDKVIPKEADVQEPRVIPDPEM